jgi:hypothetical protein
MIDEKLLPERVVALLATYTRLDESEQTAQAKVADAETNLEDALREDEHERAAILFAEAQGGDDVPEPEPLAPDARQRLEDVTLGLRSVRQARAMCLSEIAATLASEDTEAKKLLDDAEAKARRAAAKALDAFESAAADLAVVRAHRRWVRSPVDEHRVQAVNVGGPVGAAQTAELRAALAGVNVETAREQRDAHVDDWNALVQRATADLGPDRERGEADALIEAEVERLRREGQPVPTPASVKWRNKLLRADGIVA